LKKAVDTVLAQTCTDFELIVVDDGSTDGTEPLVRAYGDPRIRYVYQNNRGPAGARNRGIAEARGEFVAFLDSDDWWLEEKLKRAADFIREFPDIHVFHTEEVWYRRGRLLPQKDRHRKPDGLVYEKALPLCCISISTAVVRKTVLEEVGGFDETLPACEDYDLWLRVTHRYPVKLIPEALTEKEGGRPDELSVRVWGLDRFRIRALAKMLESGVCSRRSYAATFRELEKKCRIFAQGAEKRGRTEEAAEYLNLIKRYVR